MEFTTYWETGSLDPCWNLAFEEYLLFHKTTGTHLILWQNDKTVVIGSNQIAEAEINREYIDAHDIRVVRRCSGGGAVYHDLGNLNYSFITDYDPASQLRMGGFMRPVAAALQGLGLPAEVSGRNDMLISGRKVSGTAQRIAGGRILHHGTMLFDTDLETAAAALRVSPGKFQGKGSRSVRSRIRNIRPLLPEDMDVSSFRTYMKKALLPARAAPASLTEADKDEVRFLKEEKYDRWAWTFGRSPKGQLHAARRFPGGRMEVCANLAGGCIEGIAFYGDFLSRRPVEEVSGALSGLPFTVHAVRDALQRLELSEYFDTISLDGLLSLLFSESDQNNSV